MESPSLAEVEKLLEKKKEYQENQRESKKAKTQDRKVMGKTSPKKEKAS